MTTAINRKDAEVSACCARMKREVALALVKAFENERQHGTDPALSLATLPFAFAEALVTCVSTVVGPGHVGHALHTSILNDFMWSARSLALIVDTAPQNGEAA